ncbi:MAG: PHP domain-containing protein [Candidatus Hermodarchaeota archaeon]
MLFPKMNLHIHSNYSDGKNTIQQIVKKAIKLELDYIAITDHFTDSWKSWVSTLNNYETITSYLEEISICQKYLSTYNKNLKLLKGIEIDLSSSEQFISKYIQIDEFNLILFEYLQSYETIAFVKNIINHWKNTKINFTNLPILGLAHFDPSHFILENLDPLMKFLKEYNIYFEFNPSYATFYSPKYERFFKMLKEYEIPVGIGCDSHNLKNLNNVEEPLDMIKYYNLERNFENLISKLNI